MKIVIFGDELDKKKKDAIDLICNAVASTIGPIGNNVLINSDETLPYITNDGVTIAKAIESDDEEINGILDIIKNAAPNKIVIRVITNSEPLSFLLEKSSL